MNQSDLIQELKFQIKVLRDQLDAFRNGSKFTQLRDSYEARCKKLNRVITEKDKEIASLHAQMASIRKKWMQVNEDVVKEKDTTVAKMETEVGRAHAAETRAKEETARLRKELSDKKIELMQARVELDVAQTMIKKLEVKAGTDYTNSSLPSSSSPNHKTIVNNSREKSGLKQGGQTGHEHHPRHRYDCVNKYIKIPSEAKHLDTSRYKLTGKTVKKQLVSIAFDVVVTEYEALEYVDLKTGQRVHAAFPDGLTDDVTYDGTVKAFAYLLNNDLYASVGKTQKLIKDITKDKLNLSTGMIANLSKQFSNITKEQRREIFEKLHSSEAVHADFTFGRVNGKQGTVLVIVDAKDGTVMYQQKPAKGAKGVENSPLVGYQGTTVTDHESILVKQGNREQECLAHVSRYARGGEEHEPSKKCFPQLRKWISESVGYWDDVNGGIREPDEAYAGELKNRLYEIAQTAMKEYEEDPAPEYYKKGYNTMKRIYEKPEDYLLFLDDYSVPPTNNRAEAAGRKIKRKFRQVMAFRSDKGLKHFCDGQTIIQTLKKEGGNAYLKVSDFFNEGRGVSYAPICVYVEAPDEEAKDKMDGLPKTKTPCIEI